MLGRVWSVRSYGSLDGVCSQYNGIITAVAGWMLAFTISYAKEETDLRST